MRAESSASADNFILSPSGDRILERILPLYVRNAVYTSLVEKPLLGVWAGVATTVVAAPLVAVLPFVGAGTAIALGAGVGTGVALGVKDSKEPPKLLD